MDFGSGGGVPRGGAGRAGAGWGGVLLGQEVECEPAGGKAEGSCRAGAVGTRGQRMSWVSTHSRF